MFKQKLVSLLCAVSLIIGTGTTEVLAYNKPYECHGELVSYILPEFSEKEGNVTRAEFLKFVINLRYGKKTGKESGFKDVDQYNGASGEISFARELGIIDSGEVFYPDLPITVNQAKKIAVNLLGYKEMAELKGGYPSGYSQIADELELFSALENDKYITWQECTEVIYNILNAPLILTGIEDGNISYEVTEDANLLNTKYDIYEFSGIETANSLTSLTESDGGCEDGYVTIGTEKYLYSGEDYLGYNVSGFYRDLDGDKEIIAMRPDKNEEVKLKTDDIECFEKGILEYNTETRLNTEKIYPGYSFIYNHKAYGGDNISELMKESGAEVTFIDADRDEKFETVKMIKKDYLVVSNVNTYDLIVSGKNFERGIIKLDGDVEYKITKNNAESSIHDIAVGDLLCYTVSEDMLYYEISSVYNELSGRISAIDKEEKILKIGESEISYNSYFEKYCEDYVRLGADVVILLDDEGDACCVIEKANTYLYGWIVKKWNDEESDGICLKIFTESGDFKTYKIKDGVLVDGIKISDRNKIDEKIDLIDEKRFIRYFINANEEITKIDFSENAKGELPFVENKNENDALTRFFEETQSTFLTSGKLFSDLCKLSDSCKVFIIPESAEKRESESNYFAVSSGYFSNNTTYTVNVYDIDETKGAEAIVIFDDRNSLAMEAASAVVESVEMTLNSEDNVTYIVTLLKDGSFITAEASEEIAEKAGKLNPGDIIRYSKSSDNILLSFNLEYDCKNDVLLAVDSNQVKYRKGYLFNYIGGYATILEKNSLSGYTYKDMSLTYFGNIKPSHIYLTLDGDGTVKKAEVRNQPDSVIRSYRSVGTDCDRIITRSRFESLNSVWIYHIEY